MPSLERVPRKTVAKRRRYGCAVADTVRVVWESRGYVCAERLTPVLQDTARQLAKWEELRLTTEVEMESGNISRATVQRMIKHFQQHTPRLPRRKPQPPNRLLQNVPMERLSWRTKIPGSFETDLVHHCDPVAAGDYVHTLQLVDIATGWSEFFNAHLIRYFGEEITGLRLSRSRPYQKNDNRFVEQKNSTLVRAYVGYDRLDSVIQCAALNALYDRLWLYYNLFQPVMHMRSKEVTKGKLQRKHDKAQTSYQRLLACNILTPEQKARLDALYARTNPRQLRDEIYRAVEQLWQQPASNTINKKEAALSR